MLFTNIFIFQFHGSKEVGHEMKQSYISPLFCHYYKTESITESVTPVYNDIRHPIVA